jgi:hypothetical protein
MTFDELWRRNLDRTRGPVSSVDVPADPHFCDAAASEDSVFDDLDEAEMARFLDLLEKSL